MSTSSSDGKSAGGVRKSGVADVFRRALESRPKVAARSPEGERVELPTCANCGAPRERDATTCRYCGEAM
jgi:hypothetical protein